MKKIIFWGDGILSGSAGYAGLLENHVFLHYPRAAVSMSIQGKEGTTLAEALREAPLHAIGKDPDLLYLGFGHADIALGRKPDEIGQAFQDLIGLILQKTRARLGLSYLISSFFTEDEERARCHEVNQMLKGFAGSRVAVLDLDARVEAFLREHRESPGDQQGLHVSCSRLRPMGQLYLAHHAYSLMPWPELSASPAVTAV